MQGMPATLAFDIYGTLIDTHGVITKLQGMVGDNASPFSATWRDKQLEYSFRKGLMRKYQNFAVCTREALDYTCAYYKAPLSEERKQELLDSYRVLPAFEDVKEGLTSLKSAGYRLYALSNGTTDAVETLLTEAGIAKYFEGVVSVDEISTFKPDPDVYHHFLKKTGTEEDDAWLISSNPFDVIGAISAGMRAAWVRRSKDAIFDPWGIEPTLTVMSINDLCTKLINNPVDR